MTINKNEQIKTIEITEQFEEALTVIESTDHTVFITGRAGTGKSTLLDYFRSITRKRTVVLAPTGVAALNVRGQTIHSFFGFKPDVTPGGIKKVRRAGSDIFKRVDTIVIDEISMVRADLLDAVDTFLRLNGKTKKRPFGGIQMVFIGDLYQLPPVYKGHEKELFKTMYRSPYFFDAKVMEGLEMDFIELEKIFRQKDDVFISILNRIRNNSITDNELAILNRRLCTESGTEETLCVTLTTTNEQAKLINSDRLARIKTKKYLFHGSVDGAVDPGSLPTSPDLVVKKGAQVMFLANDSAGRWVNGTIGRISGIEGWDEGNGRNAVIMVKLPDGEIVDVTPYRWELFHFLFNPATKNIESQVVGAFTQYPLKLAWAVTIHKSQGKTFEKVIIDIGRGTFAHGQIYVALSRCTTLAGIFLRKPVEKRHVIMDYRVVRFLTTFQYACAEKRCTIDEKVAIITDAIEQGQMLDIVYLKTSDVKTRRTIEPTFIGTMEYMKRTYLGVEAFCLKRKEKRVFRVDRILEIRPLP